MRQLSVSDARNSLSDAVNQVCYGQERVLLAKYGKPVAALVSAEDLELLEALEDQADIQAIREALAEGDERIPYERLRAELDLA